MSNNNTCTSPYDMHIFKEGTEFKSYNFLGSKLIKTSKDTGAMFTVYAPNAVEVRIVGNFNNWKGEKHLMKKQTNLGFWNLFISDVSEGDIYKYEIHTANNKILLKSDPYAFYSEVRPDTASTVINIDKYNWNDEKWLDSRKLYTPFENPINIYEVHLGSWKRKDNNEFYSYKEIADMLLPYVINMGYTHIQLLPICEHPLDDSWGYQCTGYYSITSRYGCPEDFMYFVDKFHQNNIGVILDWVPGHFCKDAHGLHNFDGSSLYEYEDSLKSENYDWGTANFDLGKPHVKSFLISNAVFWFDKYHIDGIRVDAVANMLYLNYGKKENIDFKNKYGTNKKPESVKFLKELNEVLFKLFPNPLIIAEESTTWPLVTCPTYIGGLGFNYKWNMGWMNDILKYMTMQPSERKLHPNLLTFSLMYAFSENFILPLSHDEVVHGKKSLLDKMPGEYEQKFANLKLLYTYMMAHPGKKHLFMGGEFGQFIEWKDKEELDWHLLDYPMHSRLHSYVKALNSFYKEEVSLWQQDHSSDGFSWINHNCSEEGIVCFIRKGNLRDDFLIIVCNFSETNFKSYELGVPRLLFYEEVLNSDHINFGGLNIVNAEIIPPIIKPKHNMPYSVNINIPALSAIVIKPKYKKDIKRR